MAKDGKNSQTLHARQRALIEAARAQLAHAERGASAPADSTAGALPAGDSAPFAGLSSDSFTGYENLHEIHRGGQGVVYQALQKSTRRKVAIKVMREGPFAGPGDITRFEREVQVLGALNHPNIVAIHDSGSAAGHFYFVMDYISGQPLDTYMAGARHSIRDTLALFATICEAVNAAHLRGIIHRDLKPSNIRVDDIGQPHVLDFGLAKVALGAFEIGNPAAAGRLHSGIDHPDMTLTGQFVGSLPWASPEQAEGSPGKIDLRTDVYSLGVILYQMLTAKFPYDVIGPMRDVLDHIMHSQPIRPRMTGGARLARLIDDEVETIILKCLQKERDRRYQTAGELARDVRRYLAGEPIEAKRDSLTYLLRKQVRRHWRPAIAVAVVLLAITVGLVASLTAWRRAATDRARAVTAEADQRRAAAKAQAINVFLQEMLGSADPGKGPGKDVTVLSVLDDAAAKLDAGDMRDQPNVEAGVRSAIGNSYRSLGDFPAAEDNLRLAVQLNERVYGRRNLQVADSRVDLGQVLRTLVDFKGAESQYQEALAIYRAVHNSDSRGEAACLHHLALLRRTQGQYDAAEELYRQAIEMRQRVLGRDHSDVAESLSALGELCYERQDLDQAEALFREADQVNRGFFGDDHPTVAAGLNDLGAILHARGEYDQAEELYRQAVAMGRRLLGDEHPLVGQALNNLAMTLSAQRRPASAEPLFLQALALRRKQMGAEHPDVAVVANNLAAFYTSLGQPDRAEELYRDAIAIRRAALPMSPELAKSLVSYSLLLLECARAGEAEPLLREALDIRASTLAADDVKIPHTQSILGECLTALGSFDEAEPLLWQSWQALRVHRDATPERIERARTRLLRFYRASGRAAALPDESAAADDQGDSSPQADPP